jgi:hypothetical protein
MWSDAQDWPTAVGLAEGRLDLGRQRDKVWDSVSDAYESFDETLEGDAGPISRSIAIGGVNEVQWDAAAPAHRLRYERLGIVAGEVILARRAAELPPSFTLKSAYLGRLRTNRSHQVSTAAAIYVGPAD